MGSKASAAAAAAAAAAADAGGVGGDAAGVVAGDWRGHCLTVLPRLLCNSAGGYQRMFYPTAAAVAAAAAAAAANTASAHIAAAAAAAVSGIPAPLPLLPYYQPSPHHCYYYPHPPGFQSPTRCRFSAGRCH